RRCRGATGPGLARPVASACYQTDGGTVMGSLGTSVATDTCGQVRGAKFKKTVCEYWIWVMWILMGRGLGIGNGGCSRNVGKGSDGGPGSPSMLIGGAPASKGGTMMIISTVSIQKVAVISTVCAFGPCAGSPCRNAMLGVPPPNIGAGC